MTTPRQVDMSTYLGKAHIPSPVLTASGCSSFGRELEPFVDLSAIGAVVTKSVQLRPRSGRPTPRMAETPSGMLNSIGLQGPGIDGLLADDLPWLVERGARAFVSIAGTRVEDFAELATRLRGVPGVLGLEVNISCPNVESRGEVFACDPVAASDVVRAVREAADPAQPVYAKLSPDVTDIVSVARSVAAAGADGSWKTAVPTETAEAPASTNCRASSAPAMPPIPRIGTSGSAACTCQTQRRATGRIAGPDSPPVIPPSTGRMVSGSMTRPSSVLIIDRPSAPASVTDRATATMSVTSGLSLA